jgi:hypothetical protein
MEAFGTSKNTASTEATRLEKAPEIKAEIARLKQKTETSATLSRQEKREFLARVVRAEYPQIDPEDPLSPNLDLVESMQRHYNKDGELTRISFKLPSKTSAIEIDNKMAGHNEPEEHNVTFEGGVMLVPLGGATLDQWEKEAAKQQEALKSPGEKG